MYSLENGTFYDYNERLMILIVITLSRFFHNYIFKNVGKLARTGFGNSATYICHASLVRFFHVRQNQ
jgi:hypothetical protein